MVDRTFDLQVSGYTKGGYGVTVSTQEVAGSLLATSLAWLGEKLTEAGVRPLLSENGGNGTTAPEGSDTKVCPIHKVPMERHDKGKSHWYSHKVTLEDGTEHWCRGK